MARQKTNNKKDRMILSFTELDEDVYDFLKGQKNASKLIKLLVRQYMWNCKNNDNNAKKLNVDEVPFVSSSNTETITDPKKDIKSNNTKELDAEKDKEEVVVEDEVSATLEDTKDVKVSEPSLNENRLENKKLIDGLDLD